MRTTLWTASCLTTALVFATAFGVGNSQLSFAQQPEESKTLETAKAKETVITPVRDERYRAVEEALKTRAKDLNFPEGTIREVVDFISQLAKLPTIYNNQSLHQAGIDVDKATVSYHLVDVPVETALDLILGEHGLTYRIWEGFLLIESKSTAKEQMEVHVYNCRDLLDRAVTMKFRQMQLPRGMNFFQVAPDTKGDASGSKSTDSAKPQGAENKPQPEWKTVEISPSETLMEVLMNSTDGPWESIHGEGGFMNAFDGLIVVRNNQRAQRDVRNLLEMLRAADELQPHEKSESKPATDKPADASEWRHKAPSNEEHKSDDAASARDDAKQG